MLSRYASKLKGSDYRLDDRIGAGYLISVAAERAGMLVRGVLAFPTRRTHPFIGARVRLRSRGRLSYGRGVTIGHGCYIDALSEKGVQLGEHTSLGRNTRIECTGNLRDIGVGLRVGQNVGLGADGFFGCAGGVEIGSDTILGNYVSFHSENHNHGALDLPIRQQGVSRVGIVVGRNCWIGARCTILDGAVIEDGTIFAAGSVVVAGVYPRNGIYGGIPAKLLRRRT